jgi:pSer/pThr/pTyr-binding forkhead associated (FHA) protein
VQLVDRCRQPKIPLGQGEHVIGRDAASTVWLDVPGVSRRHARIVIDRNSATIEDLQSKNGTTLREQGVTGPSALHDGDRIQVGPILVVFHASASGLSTATLNGRSHLRSRKSPMRKVGRHEA